METLPLDICSNNSSRNLNSHNQHNVHHCKAQHLQVTLYHSRSMSTWFSSQLLQLKIAL
jgi:hypothetical protein